ncbi:MAG TPA: hypothetical protein VKZ67_07895 [Natronosporangium sp.]|nr:hypothetical protein [Natronosporangium sp.]
MVVPKEEFVIGALSQAARNSVEQRRRRLERARDIVLDLLQDPAHQRGGVDLRRLAFDRHAVPSQDTSAALRLLEREGVITMAPDFSYRLTTPSRRSPHDR